MQNQVCQYNHRMNIIFKTIVKHCKKWIYLSVTFCAICSPIKAANACSNFVVEIHQVTVSENMTIKQPEMY